MEHFQPPLRAPSWPASVRWVNTPEPPDASSDHPRLIIFWDYTCLSCLRALPYWRAWHDRYAPSGLKVIGVHTPEFDFAHDPRRVARAAGRLGLRWPVLLDNDQSLWTAYANKAWPAVYLLDTAGRLRVRQIGEGHYQALELEIQGLLKELDPGWVPPEPVEPIRPEDHPGAACLPSTPDLHHEALGNGPVSHIEATDLSLPDERRERHFYLEGAWKRVGDGLRLVGAEGRVVVGFTGSDAYAILGTLAALEGWDDTLQPFIPLELHLDGQPLEPDSSGEDVLMHEGHPIARIDLPRLYALVRSPSHGQHELEIIAKEAGLIVYGFSFDTCPTSTPTALQPQEA